MLDRTIVFLDLETTGATAHSDRITEIGLVEVDHGTLVGEWSSLVNPGRSIPPNIQALTGITDAMVEKAPEFADLAQSLFERLDGKLLVAHNARFDFGFLNNEFRLAGFRYEPDVLCTVRLSRRLFPEQARHNLDSLIERHGLACEDRHRALADARVLWDFTRKIHVEVEPDRIRSAVDELLRKPVLPPKLAADALEGIPDGPGVYTFRGTQDEPLYAGKGSNLRARIISHFAADPRSTRDRRIGRETTRLEWKATAGELGALILHQQTVARLNPALNRRSRTRTDRYAFAWDAVAGPKTPELVCTSEPGFREGGNRYGLFESKRAASNALRTLADEHGLCHKALGLEKGDGPCLGHRLKHCRGTCVGEESAIAHAMRLTQALHALRLPDWPFRGAIGIREYEPLSGRSQTHVFDRWCHLGSFDTEADLGDALQARSAGHFDADLYKLLRRFFRDKPAHVGFIPLP